MANTTESHTDLYSAWMLGLNHDNFENLWFFPFPEDGAKCCVWTTKNVWKGIFLKKGDKNWFLVLVSQNSKHTYIFKYDAFQQNDGKEIYLLHFIGKKGGSEAIGAYCHHCDDWTHKTKLSPFIKMIAPITWYTGISKEMLPKRIILYLTIYSPRFISNTS